MLPYRRPKLCAPMPGNIAKILSWRRQGRYSRRLIRPAGGGGSSSVCRWRKKRYQAAKAVSPEIVQTQVAVMDVLSHVLVANSYGVWAEDERARAQAGCFHRGGQVQTEKYKPGLKARALDVGLNSFSDLDIEGAARAGSTDRASPCCMPRYAPAGKMAVAVGRRVRRRDLP